MKKAGIAPAIIYASEKTGRLLVTEQNQHLISARLLPNVGGETWPSKGLRSETAGVSQP